MQPLLQTSTCWWSIGFLVGKNQWSNLLSGLCQWFSGKIQRCHRWAPSSILGWRIFPPGVDTVAEWLRRLTRNQLGLSRAGSSPVSVDEFLLQFFMTIECYAYGEVPSPLARTFCGVNSWQVIIKIIDCAQVKPRSIFELKLSEVGNQLDLRQWCSGNINAFQAFALSSILGWRSIVFIHLSCAIAGGPSCMLWHTPQVLISVGYGQRCDKLHMIFYTSEGGHILQAVQYAPQQIIRHHQRVQLNWDNVRILPAQGFEPRT